MSNLIGYIAHANLNMYGGILRPIEFAMCNLRDGRVFLGTIDNSSYTCTKNDLYSNISRFIQVHHLPLDFCGTLKWDEAKRAIVEEYIRWDERRCNMIAVLNPLQKSIFKETTLPIFDISDDNQISVPRINDVLREYKVPSDDDIHSAKHILNEPCSRNVVQCYRELILHCLEN
ncbi:hypothetical protein HNY73_011281 [Argiope bruennichi]|uniref:Uncharacterized protein n=1 Tax=Argiope bruennichi TaxID=94029 RepID=A0A8T0F3L2_ARGBR|nr:hypothetical protein HNY73_011281 [Argiope bruennichi]